ncbi:MAG: tRNA dihydrouridine synthase DusB [Bacteroidales bacterium]|nr:tRNA dihydrouridine synthase DusB [Bacteroidales bacterium]
MFSIGKIKFDRYPLFLAPMEDVTDVSFRHICKMYGADMLYTEFIASEALVRNIDKTVKKMHLEDAERPAGIQIYGHDPEHMVEAARMAAELKPDLIDINCGCPVKKIATRGDGAGLLQTPDLMVKIVEDVVKAVPDIPVTVKTRLGWDDSTKIIVPLAERLQDAGIKALTIHGRTRMQLYKGEADWTLIGEVKNNPRMTIPIIGNGDVDSPQKAAEMRSRYGVDAIMIGRAAVGCPWIFKTVHHYLETGEMPPEPSLAERVHLAKYQLETSMNWKGDMRGLLEMRRHYSQYFKGLPDFKPYRMRLVTEPDPKVINSILDEIGEVYKDYIFE